MLPCPGRALLTCQPGTSLGITQFDIWAPFSSLTCQVVKSTAESSLILGMTMRLGGELAGSIGVGVGAGVGEAAGSAAALSEEAGAAAEPGSSAAGVAADEACSCSGAATSVGAG